MNNYERTMREEKWMLTNELFTPTRFEPPEVIAFRMLQEPDWEHFMTEIVDNPAMKFFNPELREFSSAESWADLSSEYDTPPYAADFAIPDSIPENVKDFFRQLRNSMRESGDEWTGGCKAFYSPEEWVDPVSSGYLAIVCHDGGSVAPRFNLNYERIKLYDEVDHMLRHRGLWREHKNAAVSYILNL